MEALKNRYRAYREYRERLEGDEAHRALMRALESGVSGREACNGSVSRCVLEEDWIGAIERGLPYVERALDEQRRFIESTEEIRRIDQAKKISPESIRHLAQHSNMISRFDGDDVVPDRVLIVERDDNYAIYENRFLFTLVQRLQAFLDERYCAVAGLNGAEAFSFMAEREAVWSRCHLKASVSLSVEQRAAKARPEAASGEAAGMDRLIRLKSRAGDLAAAPLMRLLKGTTPVTSPIVRTNVFKKNPNFAGALELFEFLEGYRKPGYEVIVDAPEAGGLSDGLRGDICAGIALAELAGRLDSDRELAQALEENYRLENERAEQERIRLEQEREQQVLARIQAARDEEIAIREAEIARREAIIAQQRRSIDALNDRCDAMKAELRESSCRIAAQEQTIREQSDRIDEQNLRMQADADRIAALSVERARLGAELAAMKDEARRMDERWMRLNGDFETRGRELQSAQARAGQAEQTVVRLEKALQQSEDRRKAEADRASGRVQALSEEIEARRAEHEKALEESLRQSQEQMDALRRRLAHARRENRRLKEKCGEAEPVRGGLRSLFRKK